MKSTKKIFILVIAIMLIFSAFSVVNAAGSFSVKASATSTTVGKTINLTISTTNAEGKFTIASSNSNIVSVSTASTWVTSSQTIALTAKAAGTATITITPTDVSDTDLNKITGAKTVTITVKDNTPAQQPQNPSTGTTTTKSSDATLKSITIGNKTYSGSSLKNTISYTAEANVSSIKISAVKNHSKASVSGTGTKSLIAGQTNKFKITVKAEDGTQKTYNLNIIRLAEEAKEPNIIENEIPVEEVKLALTSLVIKDVELNTEFNPEVYSYIANVKNMTELEIVATANKEGVQINIEGATGLKEGDNKVKIIATLGEEKVEYVIDVYNTIQEEAIGTIQEETNANTPTEDKTIIGNIQNFVSDNSKEIILVSLIIILSLISIRYVALSYKYSNKLKELMELKPQENTEIADRQAQISGNIKKENSKMGRHF